MDPKNKRPSRRSALATVNSNASFLFPARRGLICMLALWAALAAPCRSQAVFQIYLELPGIPGESVHKDYKDWIEVHEISFGQMVLNLSHDGKFRAMPSFSDVTVAKYTDKATALLLNHCARSEKIKSAKIHFVVIGEQKPRVFYEIELGNLIVRGIDLESNGPADIPTERVTLQFSSIAWKYTQFVGNGFKLAKSESSWDVIGRTGTGGKAEGVFKFVAAANKNAEEVSLSFVPQ